MSSLIAKNQILEETMVPSEFLSICEEANGYIERPISKKKQMFKSVLDESIDWEEPLQEIEEELPSESKLQPIKGASMIPKI